MLGRCVSSYSDQHITFNWLTYSLYEHSLLVKGSQAFKQWQLTADLKVVDRPNPEQNIDAKTG